MFCRAFLLAAALAFWVNTEAQDTTRTTNRADTLKYPITDRRGDKLTNPSLNPFDLRDPANISDSIEYDPKTKQYYLIEKVGNFYYRKPTYLTFDEYMRIQSRRDENDYFKKRANIVSGLNKRLLKPKLSITDNLFNRIFGNGKVEIRPQGNVDILAGYQGQNIKNPTLPERARRNGGFDFDMNANLNVIANIGDKMRLPINYNTLANFDFENQLKLDYTGTNDEIIRRLEAGNVNFTSKGSLIAGAQSLFGLKTQLQFGRLGVTAVLANQRAQRQSLGLQGGAASTLFEFKADDYEENRHFLLAQYFRQNYNTAMSSLPAVQSLVQILRIEVWVTNRNGSTIDTRDVVALMDLGESRPFQQPPVITPLTTNAIPYNDANDLYRNIINDPNSRGSSTITTKLNQLGLRPVQDFEKTFARKLTPSDYYFNPQIGFISLTQPLQADEVLGVAYQYSYNGKIYQVGEFSQDVPPDTTAVNSGNQKVLLLKLLKATSQRPTLPLWDLMMKNVYALKTRDNSYLTSIQPTDFQLNVLYEQPSLGSKRYLPEGPKSGLPLITVLNLDRLNNQRDPQPDGIFDYIEGFTIISNQARIIFPLLEPFGRDLDSVAFQGATPDLKSKYVFYPLYDTIKEIAKTYANLDRFLLSGSAKGQSTSEISLGAFNVPQGSVTVSSGGRTLLEGVDYTVDYNLGSVKIINQAILNSGVPVSVNYENNAGFGIQQRNFMGLRLDYQLMNTAKKSLSIGASMVRLSERPYFTKMNYNEDPIRNTMYGVDFNYRSELPQLTHWLNKLPFYTTSEMSNILAYGEAAVLRPGHPSQIGKGSNGLIYIDDFEGTRNSIDLRFPLISWSLASTPQNNGRFPEGSLIDSVDYGFNRSKLAWYNIEPNLQDPRGTNNPVKGYQDFTDPRIHGLNQQQLYPAKTPEFGQAQLITFDMAFYPRERGPYNFDTRAANIDRNTGKFLNPKARWGGIMRALDQVDFETGNVEYIEFWMQDPNILNPNSTGGSLFFNLGNISEDVLRDGKRSFENGLPTPNIQAEVANSTWGRVPSNPIQVTQAFSNDPSDRPFQDVGFDGLNDTAENNKFSSYLNRMQGIVSDPVFQGIKADPSGDNFKNYRDESFDAQRAGILARYKNINSPQGNSPIALATATSTAAFTLYPDQEDLNRDNTLNELEEYFEYEVKLDPQNLRVGQNHITDVREFVPSIAGAQKERWFLFRIPIDDYNAKIGNIPDFKSIRFIRMYMTGFEDSVVCRFAKLELVRNNWRNFAYSIDTTGTYKPLPANSSTTLNVLAVNLEENSSRQPVPYVIPPGIERVQQLSNNNVNILQNEQALSMQICGLQRQDSRGVFKTLNLDLRQYRKLQMYIHAESVTGTTALNDNEINAVIRIGNDFISNFYEIKIPLKITRAGQSRDSLVWPSANNLDLDLERLTQLKVTRNNSVQPSQFYQERDASGKSYAILGNPNLGEVRGIFMGIQNINNESVCTEAWFNELRLSEIDEKGGYAALGRVDIKLADLGTISMAGNVKTRGFGTIEQRVNERAREDLTQFDLATQLELGKLLPRKAAISIPVYAGVSQTVSTPEYDPYDLDIKLDDKIKGAPSDKRDSIRNDAIDITTIKTVTFTNVKKANTTGKKQKIWSIENFDINYSYTKSEHHNPLIESDEVIKHRGGLGYNYAATPEFKQPFKRVFRTKSPWLDLIRDFNFNPSPSLLSFRTDINRQFGAFRPRNVGGPKNVLPETYNKYFTFDRFYNLRWDITRSLNIDFTATNRARVDEAPGRLSKYEQERMWNRFFKGGRNTSYEQTANASYVLPTAKLPLLNWTNFRVAYTARYNWLAASLDPLAKSLGNFITNSQTKNATGEFDFTRLYRNSRLLRALDWDAAAAPAPPPQQPQNKADTSANGKKKKVKRNPNEPLVLPGAVKFVGRFVTAVKRVGINYSETGNTNLAGYLDSTQAFGMNFKTRNPGWGFVFGQQPDTNFINRFAQKGALTKNILFNTLNRQDYSQRLSITAQLIPIRDFTIDVNMDKTFGKTYSELYKDTIGSATSQFVRLNPYAAGNFNVTFLSFQTLFQKFKPNEISATFRRFEANRLVLSNRLGKQNGYINQSSPNIKDAEGYYIGYGKYAQNVLIPSFIAAYTNSDPNTVALLKENNPNIRSNPFAGILPKPNWRVTYNGLNRIEGLSKIFTNFTLSHGYTSNLSMNSFNSDLLFSDPLLLGVPFFRDTSSGNYVPFFLVPNVSISEAFAPLLDMDMQFTNQLTARFEYKKSRQLSLSLVDFQLSESRSTEFVIGAGWRKRGFPLPFKVPFTKKDTKKLENDINFRLDFSIRDDATANSRLDQDAALPTGGQKVVTISPSIDYVLNNRVNVKLYFDQRRVEPKISTSAPITTTRAGLQIRISLAQ
ncbi:MAG: cell surface protein SprA [Williamsia sp.]|nr:cell surface protein SprA [Williamsia sp.]